MKEHSLIFGTWLVRMCDMTHVDVCVTCLIFTSILSSWRLTAYICIYIYIYLYTYERTFFHIWDMARKDVWHDLYTHVCDMTHTHVCVTWLIRTSILSSKRSELETVRVVCGTWLICWDMTHLLGHDSFGCVCDMSYTHHNTEFETLWVGHIPHRVWDMTHLLGHDSCGCLCDMTYTHLKS